MFYFLLQSQVCQYLEDRPPLRRHYKVLPVFYKSKCYLNTDSLYMSLITSLISLVLKKYSKHDFKLLLGLSHPHIQHLQDSRALSNEKAKQQRFKRWLCCLIKVSKTLAFDVNYLMNLSVFKTFRRNMKVV